MPDHATGVSPPPKPEGKRAFWKRLKAVLLHQLSGVTVAGIIGTLIVAYFQNLSAYEDKVAALAKDDLAAATQTFADISGALSTGLSMQQRLIDYFYDALCKDLATEPQCKKPLSDDNSYLAKSARALYGDYMTAFSNLHRDYNLTARKAEIFLDWPSNAAHNAADDVAPGNDPINMSLLGASEFDCELSMPGTPIKNTKGGLILNESDRKFDWNSAKHHVLATQYCFDVTHKNLTAALQWASQSNVGDAEWGDMTKKDRIDLFKNKRATNQVLRLNAFIALAMSEIERMRVKYRPNGYWCSVPGVREWLMAERCLPVRIAQGDQRPGVATKR